LSEPNGTCTEFPVHPVIGLPACLPFVSVPQCDNLLSTLEFGAEVSSAPYLIFVPEGCVPSLLPFMLALKGRLR